MPTQKQCVQRLEEIRADLGMTNILFYPTTQNIIELPLYQQKKQNGFKVIRLTFSVQWEEKNWL